VTLGLQVTLRLSKLQPWLRIGQTRSIAQIHLLGAIFAYPIMH
jgi:hypothetical protein